MKNKLFFLLLSTCFLFGACKSNPNTLSVKGTITGFEKGTVITLWDSSQDENFAPMDSTVLSAKGTFTLKAEIAGAGAGKYFVFIGDPDGQMFYKEFWGAPGHVVHITGDHLSSQSWAVKSDIPEQIEQNRFEDTVRKPLYELEKRYSRMRKLDAQMQSGAGDVSVQQEFDSLRRESNASLYEIYDITLNVILENPHTDQALEELLRVAWNLKSQDNLKPLREKTEQAYRLLTPEEQQSPIGAEIDFILFWPQAEEGAAMIDAELPDLNGNLRKLSEFKGKYILLNFWASWCGYCVAGFPELKAFAESNKGSVTVIGMNLDENPADWRAATEQHGINWVNLGMGSNMMLPRQYGVSSIPHAVLISPEGTVLKIGWNYDKGKLAEEFRAIAGR